MTFSLLPTAYSIIHGGHDTIEAEHDKCVARSTIGRRAGQQHRHVLVYGIARRPGLRKYLQLSSMHILRTGTSTCSNLINVACTFISKLVCFLS